MGNNIHFQFGLKDFNSFGFFKHFIKLDYISNLKVEKIAAFDDLTIFFNHYNNIYYTGKI